MTQHLRSSAARLSDEALMGEVKRLAGCERDATAQLIAHLAELDARRLYLGAGFSSLFVYCTAALRLSECEAYNRIEAARAARRFPAIFGLLQDGSVNLTTIRLLASHLTDENHGELLTAASGRSRREVEALLAQRSPRPAAPASVRKVPEAKTSAPPLVPVPVALSACAPEAVPVEPPLAMPAPLQRRALVAPLSTDQYKITFTARAETHRKLRLAQDLLRHQVPDGELSEIFDRALSALLEDLAKKKLGASSRPRRSQEAARGSRHIPAAVKRAVWLRDGGRCAFIAKDGRRCGEQGFLEFHHLKPYAAGGEATAENVALRCRPHNGHEADLYFGPREPVGGADRVGESQLLYGYERANSSWNEPPRSPTATTPETVGGRAILTGFVSADEASLAPRATLGLGLGRIGAAGPSGPRLLPGLSSRGQRVEGPALERPVRRLVRRKGGIPSRAQRRSRACGSG